MKRSKLLFILFQVTLVFWRFTFWKHKILHDEFLHDKDWIPPEPYMLFMLGKLLHICCLLLHWVLSSFVNTLWEVCHALKIKITYTLHIPVAPTLGVRKNMPYLPKNVLLLYWGWTQRHIRFFIHQINAPSSCYHLSKFCCRKET
jgi:hypothetical protein